MERKDSSPRSTSKRTFLLWEYNDSEVQEILTIDWPNNWYDQLNLTAKLIDAVNRFGSSGCRDYLMNETSALMQHYYLLDFDYEP